MQIYVCVKHVPDTAARIRVQTGDRFDESVNFLINPYDENAVEEAVRMAQGCDRAEVIAVTLGKAPAVETLRAAMAMGVDRALHVLCDTRPDSVVTARALAAAIRQDGQPDIVFTGRESIDSEGMQTMFRLAAVLDVPVASNVVAFNLQDGKAVVESELEAGTRAVLELPLPCVIGAAKGLNTPRYPKFPDIMKAKKKPLRQVTLADLALSPPAAGMTVREMIPAVEERHAISLEGTADELAEHLHRLLRDEAKVI